MQKTPVLTFDIIKQTIIACLSPDLLSKDYAELIGPNDPPETGHCAVATEAFYHLAGGKEAGFVPVVCPYFENDTGTRVYGRHDKDDMNRKGFSKYTHWWTRGPDGDQKGSGDLYDVTSGQYPNGFDYEYGRNTGFMQPLRKPSIRAQILMDRVAETFGAAALEKFRAGNIASYKAAREFAESPIYCRNPHLKII